MTDPDNPPISGKELKENFDSALTLEKAQEWDDTDEKWIHCVDELMVSAHENRSDRWVNKLEAAYVKLPM